MDRDREWMDCRGIVVTIGATIAHYQQDKRRARTGTVTGTRDFPPRLLVTWDIGPDSCVKPKNVMVLLEQKADH